MSMMQYLSAFRFFRPSVLLIALGVTVACSLLKKTALKNCPEKIRTFLPFAVGFVFYAIFRLLATGSILPLTDDYAQTLEGGFACGCAATLYYLAYEQLLCKKGNSKNPVLPLLKGIVKEEVREETAAYILGNLPDAEEAGAPGEEHGHDAAELGVEDDAQEGQEGQRDLGVEHQEEVEAEDVAHAVAHGVGAQDHDQLGQLGLLYGQIELVEHPGQDKYLYDVLQHLDGKAAVHGKTNPP